MMNPNLQHARYQRVTDQFYDMPKIPKWALFHVLSMGRMRYYLVSTYAMQLVTLSHVTMEQPDAEPLDEESLYYKVALIAYKLKNGCEAWEEQMLTIESMLGIAKWSDHDQLKVDEASSTDPTIGWNDVIVKLAMDGAEILETANSLTNYAMDKTIEDRRNLDMDL